MKKSIKAAAPDWARTGPVHALDCRTFGADASCVEKAAEEAARDLSGDEVLAVTLDTEPESLCRRLGDRGFEYWSSPVAGGQRTVYFRREFEC